MAKRRDPRVRSMEFTPTAGKAARYSLDKIPADLWRSFRMVCKARKISIRAALLGFARDQVEAAKKDARGRQLLTQIDKAREENAR